MPTKHRSTRKSRSRSSRSEPSPDFVEEVLDAVATHPAFRGSAGRIPSRLWTREAIKEFRDTVRSEGELIDLVVAKRLGLLERVRVSKY